MPNSSGVLARNHYLLRGDHHRRHHLGITLANVFQPGAGVDMSQLATVDISKYQSTTEAVQSSSHGIMGTILSLVPTNIVASMAKGEMLPIIFFSVLFGLGLSSCPRRIVNRW